MTKTISDLIELKNSRVTGRYLKKKVSMGHFIEDYISEKVDIKVSFMELLKYKDDIFNFNFASPHYYFFISRMIPEVVIHSQKQDKRIIKSHYDDKNDLFSWFLGTKMNRRDWQLKAEPDFDEPGTDKCERRQRT